MGPRGSKEPAQPRITLSVHLRQELVHGSAGESEAGTTSGVGGGGLPGLAPGTDVRSRLQHLGLVCGLNLQGKPEARESEVQVVGQITRKGPRGRKPGSRMQSRVQDGL